MAKRITVKELVGKLKKDHPRVEFYGLHYYEICRDACTQARKLRSDVEKMRERMPKPAKKEDMFKLCMLGRKAAHLRDEIHRQSVGWATVLPMQSIQRSSNRAEREPAPSYIIAFQTIPKIVSKPRTFLTPGRKYSIIVN